ncbi:MAG TPA: Ig-like domain-containing protein, partial [Ardenticatenaceae bacterium]|nr:Ig-like domain-containing protein [Ardenticatenaceae bacterium]
MRQRAFRWLLPLLLVLSMVVPAGSALAAPQAQDDAPSITGAVWVTTDPEDFENLEETTFSTDVDTIYAGMAIRFEEQVEDEVSAEVDISFVTPAGRPWRDAEWYEADDDAEIVISSDFTEDSIARMGIQIAGTDAAELAGEWSVIYELEGEQIAVITFNLVSGGNPAQTGDFDIEAEVTDAGYTFLGAGTDSGTTDDGDEFTLAWLAMDAIVHSDLQDERLAQQVYDGFGFLNQGFPEVDVYQLALDYNEQLALIYFAAREGWELFDAGDIEAEEFWAEWALFQLYDKEEERFLTEEEAQDFEDKDFTGSGTGDNGGLTPDGGDGPPINPIDLGDPDNPTNPSVGAVRLEASTLNVAADDEEGVTLTATVIGGDNEPVADEEVSFEVSGSAGGRVRPSTTTTDEDGVAEVVYTPEGENGTANITASAGGRQATVSIQVGEEDGGDNGQGGEAFDSTIAYLENEGYTVQEVGYIEDDPAWPYVAMDAVSPNLDEDHVTQVVQGWVSLWQFLEDTDGLNVFLLY